MWRLTRPRTVGITIAVAGLALVSLTACGSPEPDSDGVVSLVGATADPGGSGTPTPTSTMSEEDRVFAFAACMRENGVDMPDPEIDANGGIKMRVGGPGGLRIDPKKLGAAQQKCKEFAPFGGRAPKLDPEQVEQLQKMAQCMREQGIDVPDPGEDGRIEIQRGAKDGKGTNAAGIDREDPEVQAAMKACQKFMPERLGPGRGTS